MDREKKKIVYWGIGNACQWCLEMHPDIIPEFFIDSYSNQRTLHGKIVKKPNQVKNWSQYFIVITVVSDSLIIEELENRGLCRGVNFCGYRDFFLCSSVSTQKSIDMVSVYVEKQIIHKKPIMLMVPIVTVRNSPQFSAFIKAYVNAHLPQKIIIFSHLEVISSEDATSYLDLPIFDLPDICKWNGMKGDYELFLENITELSWEEEKWLEQLENRKKNIDKEKSIKYTKEIYCYYLTLFKILNPEGIIIWGGWSRESYILGHLAKINGIPYGYMEHGWIPGTYQVDPRGIMGQSEYAVCPHMFEKLVIEQIYDIEKIKQYILENKLDTRAFVETQEDNAALKHINKDKKTVFLVGMDDYGMQMNPNSEYWKKYISDRVESTEQALFELIDVCKKNDWNLIFKPHPGNPIPNLDNYIDDIILVLDMEIDRLIQIADVVVSIASAVDYKTLIYGKPLVQLGLNGLIGKGCSYIVNEETTLEKQILLALKDGMTSEQKDNYSRLLQILLQHYLWDDMSERELRYGKTVERSFLNG